MRNLNYRQNIDWSNFRKESLIAEHQIFCNMVEKSIQICREVFNYVRIRYQSKNSKTRNSKKFGDGNENKDVHQSQIE